MQALIGMFFDMLGVIQFMMQDDDEQFNDSFTSVLLGAHNAFWDAVQFAGDAAGPVGVGDDDDGPTETGGFNPGQQAMIPTIRDAGEEYIGDGGALGFDPQEYREVMYGSTDGAYGAMSQTIDQSTITVQHCLTDSGQGVLKFVVGLGEE